MGLKLTPSIAPGQNFIVDAPVQGPANVEAIVPSSRKNQTVAQILEGTSSIENNGWKKLTEVQSIHWSKTHQRKSCMLVPPGVKQNMICPSATL